MDERVPVSDYLNGGKRQTRRLLPLLQRLSSRNTMKGGVFRPRKQSKVANIHKSRSTPDTQRQRSTPDTQRQRGAPDTQRQRGAPDTQRQRGAPDTQRQRGAPDTQRQRGAPSYDPTKSRTAAQKARDRLSAPFKGLAKAVGAIGKMFTRPFKKTDPALKTLEAELKKSKADPEALKLVREARSTGKLTPEKTKLLQDKLKTLGKSDSNMARISKGYTEKLKSANIDPIKKDKSLREIDANIKKRNDPALKAANEKLKNKQELTASDEIALRKYMKEKNPKMLDSELDSKFDKVRKKVELNDANDLPEGFTKRADGTFSGPGNKKYIMDADGKTLKGFDGSKIQTVKRKLNKDQELPEGFKRDKNGNLLDKSGKPCKIDKDGVTIIDFKGNKHITKPREVLKPNEELPPGFKKNAQGDIEGPDGTPHKLGPDGKLVDSKGNKVDVPRRDPNDPDRILRDPDGKPTSGQVVKDREGKDHVIVNNPGGGGGGGGVGAMIAASSLASAFGTPAPASSWPPGWNPSQGPTIINSQPPGLNPPLGPQRVPGSEFPPAPGWQWVIDPGPPQEYKYVQESCIASLVEKIIGKGASCNGNKVVPPPPGPSTPGASTPGASTPGASTPGASTPGGPGTVPGTVPGGPGTVPGGPGTVPGGPGSVPGGPLPLTPGSTRYRSQLTDQETLNIYDTLRSQGNPDTFCRSFTDDPDCAARFRDVNVDTSGGI